MNSIKLAAALTGALLVGPSAEAQEMVSSDTNRSADVAEVEERVRTIESSVQAEIGSREVLSSVSRERQGWAADRYVPGRVVDLGDAVVYEGGHHREWANCFPNVYFPEEGVMIGYYRSALDTNDSGGQLHDRPLVWNVSEHEIQERGEDFDVMMFGGAATVIEQGLELRSLREDIQADVTDSELERYLSAIRDSGLYEIIPTPEVVVAERVFVSAVRDVEIAQSELAEAMQRQTYDEAEEQVELAQNKLTMTLQRQVVAGVAYRYAITVATVE